MIGPPGGVLRPPLFPGGGIGRSLPKPGPLGGTPVPEIGGTKPGLGLNGGGLPVAFGGGKGGSGLPNGGALPAPVGAEPNGGGLAAPIGGGPNGLLGTGVAGLNCDAALLV